MSNAINYEREISCVACGRRNERSVLKYGKYNLVTCRGCGLIYQNPRVSVERAIQIFESGYEFRGKYRYDEGFKLDQIERRDFHIWEESIKHILAAVGESAGKKFLDIGCSYGHLLLLASRHGFEVEGADISHTMISYVRKHFNFPCYVGTIEDAPVKALSYDVICARHTLEHILHPERFLERVRELLKPDGILYLELPNVNGWDVAFKRFLVNLGIRKNPKFWNFDVHFFHYSPRTLALLLHRHGFEVISWRTYANRHQHIAPVYYALTALHRHLRFGNKMRVVARLAKSA